MKTIVLLFGEMGSGKSYLGRKMAAERDLLFIEGDALVPPDMVQRVSKFKLPTAQMLAQLVDTLKLQIAYLCSGSKSGLVISQALYRDEHRHALIDYWMANGYQVEPHWIRPGLIQNIKQLWNRTKGGRWILYWLMNKPWFQKPTHKVIILPNKQEAL